MHDGTCHNGNRKHTAVLTCALRAACVAGRGLFTHKKGAKREFLPPGSLTHVHGAVLRVHFANKNQTRTIVNRISQKKPYIHSPADKFMAKLGKRDTNYDC